MILAFCLLLFVLTLGAIGLAILYLRNTFNMAIISGFQPLIDQLTADEAALAAIIAKIQPGSVPAQDVADTLAALQAPVSAIATAIANAPQ
jgi:hypothetical protein